MAILVTSGNALGLRALGSGGRTATGSYDQIVRLLRQTLGSEHAALFSEPSARGGMVDWFTNFDSDARPARLEDAEPSVRETARANLERLVRDIEGKAVGLQKSDRQDERILGDMLSRALEVPDESAIFQVGTQPVLTFWGYTRDQGRAAENPLRAVIRRRPPEPPAPPATRGLEPGSSPSLPEPGATASSTAATIERAAPTLWTPPGAAVWAIFGALLVAIGIMLLRGCAIGLPYALTGWILNYCPGSADSGALAALAAERAKQTTLQAEYDELVRDAELKRQACFIQKPKPPAPKPPEPVKPVEPPPKPPEPVKPVEPPAPVMTIPTAPNKENPLDFIKGCWVAHDNLQEVQNGKDTGQTVTVTLCFNADGTGSRKIKYTQDQAQCRGAIRAHLDGDDLVIDIDRAVCDGNHGAFGPARAVCRRAPNGQAQCDETATGETKPDFTNFPFTRVDQD